LSKTIIIDPQNDNRQITKLYEFQADIAYHARQIRKGRYTDLETSDTADKENFKNFLTFLDVLNQSLTITIKHGRHEAGFLNIS
jgi:hypothetical protein